MGKRAVNSRNYHVLILVAAIFGLAIYAMVTRSAISNSSHNIDELGTTLQAANTAKSKLGKDGEIHKNEKSTLKTETDDLRRQLQKEEQSYLTTSEEKYVLLAQIDTLQTKFGEMTSRRQQLQAQEEDASLALAQLKKDVQDCEERRATLKDEVDEINESNYGLNRQREEAQRQTDVLQMAILELESQIADARTAIQEAREKVAQAQAAREEAEALKLAQQAMEENNNENGVNNAEDEDNENDNENINNENGIDNEDNLNNANNNENENAGVNGLEGDENQHINANQMDQEIDEDDKGAPATQVVQKEDGEGEGNMVGEGNNNENVNNEDEFNNDNNDGMLGELQEQEKKNADDMAGGDLTKQGVPSVCQEGDENCEPQPQQ
eukprot:TRINITY_DN11611_c0_g1::TRINITY_DN11611_c0_g1_i1::g.21975::m.21975 TRINITY_DN11611_c0_g1::TRINITY_DN11611_c0_g1_i1::g.21975  ORF type:complete len:382 (-),score=92.72,IncA/PF04156.9/0.01,IncA/PF04156.9/0.005,CCDC155/PF14662.1/0.00089,CCDC155/PF14662.1/2.1e+03,FliJ/PF02050.11/5.1e+02,FliJ/PF02050.11/2.2e+03,FliJ/PF02050.11/0.0069,FliJ/PF02050.11/4.6e+03,CENP-F_leu_zip/PF10473.4/0.22,CENP-F_leu_zip/PF10473.4/26,CENP-F_leu_zip/PF10473.4/33,Reo_sigmaC/PF04582.7/1.5e+02,Reo_sigmaC/PF04582.7/0.28,FUSC/